ncbi:MAG: hypothetical protein WDZ54_04990 [Sneathiella sp.]
MVRFLVAAIFIGTFATSAFAEEIRLEVSRAACEQFVKYRQSPDVTYQPGVDAHGKPVAPADLEDERANIPDQIYVNLALPLKDLLKDYNPKLADAEVNVGIVEFDIASGQLLYNGQALTDPAENAIAKECRQRYQ